MRRELIRVSGVSFLFRDVHYGDIAVTKLRILLIGAFLATGMMVAAPSEAFAQSEWIDGRPIFESDRRRAEEFLNRERQSSRRNYNVVYPEIMEGGGRPPIIAEAPPIVTLARSEPAGTIIIDSGGRRLYFTLAGNKAYEYPISVGREGFSWTGTETVSRVAAWPDWHPPAEMRKREPGLPRIMYGGIRNPLGAKALYLGNTLYRIHGTNDPRTIGQAASSGCFRMINQHVTHLAQLAGVGTKVRVVANYAGGPMASR